MSHCTKSTLIEQLAVVKRISPSEQESLFQLVQKQDRLDAIYLRELLTTLAILDKKNRELFHENTTIKNNITRMVSVSNIIKTNKEKKKTRRSSIYDSLLDRKIISVAL